MTFPEAGLQILEKTGHPMHFQEIVDQAIAEGLLSHVGQIPEQTMRQRLTALAKRSSDRKLMVVGPGKFALTDWGFAEDPAALSDLEQPPEPSVEKPLRGKERHPPVLRAAVRAEAGRSAGGKKKRRLPPLAAVVAEILGTPGVSDDIEALLAVGRAKGAMSDDLSADQLLSTLQEENRRRAKAGREPAFAIDRRWVELLTAEPLDPPRPELPEGRPEGRDAAESWEPSAAIDRPPAGEVGALVLESRRQAARALKRKVQDLPPPAVERLTLSVLQKAGYREARAVQLTGMTSERLYVARRRLGVTELRFLCQVLPAGRQASRESVQALRGWLEEAQAHAAVVIGPGESTSEARSESQRFGQPLLSLLVGDSFFEELVLRQVGVQVYEATAVDEGFWRAFRRPPEPRAESKPNAGGNGRPATWSEGRGDGPARGKQVHDKQPLNGAANRVATASDHGPEAAETAGGSAVAPGREPHVPELAAFLGEAPAGASTPDVGRGALALTEPMVADKAPSPIAVVDVAPAEPPYLLDGPPETRPHTAPIPVMLLTEVIPEAPFRPEETGPEDTEAPAGPSKRPLTADPPKVD